MFSQVPTINLFTVHVPPVRYNGRDYHFRTLEGAEKFLAVVGRSVTKNSYLTINARECHKPAQRIMIPECVRRETVKAQLGVITEPPPDRPHPTPALRLVKSKRKPEAEKAA